MNTKNYEQITISRGNHETLIRIGSITYLADQNAFDRILDFAKLFHHVWANRETPSDLQKLDTCTVEATKNDPHETANKAKKPPAEAWKKAWGRNPFRDLATAEAITQIAYQEGMRETSIALLFGVAYEWGRINGKKERRRKVNPKSSK